MGAENVSFKFKNVSFINKFYFYVLQETNMPLVFLDEIRVRYTF